LRNIAAFLLAILSISSPTQHSLPNVSDVQLHGNISLTWFSLKPVSSQADRQFIDLAPQALLIFETASLSMSTALWIHGTLLISMLALLFIPASEISPANN
jgi:hypothetical protein